MTTIMMLDRAISYVGSHVGCKGHGEAKACTTHTDVLNLRTERIMAGKAVRACIRVRLLRLTLRERAGSSSDQEVARVVQRANFLSLFYYY